MYQFGENIIIERKAHFLLVSTRYKKNLFILYWDFYLWGRDFAKNFHLCEWSKFLGQILYYYVFVTNYQNVLRPFSAFFTGHINIVFLQRLWILFLRTLNLYFRLRSLFLFNYIWFNFGILIFNNISFFGWRFRGSASKSFILRLFRRGISKIPSFLFKNLFFSINFLIDVLLSFPSELGLSLTLCQLCKFLVFRTAFKIFVRPRLPWFEFGYITNLWFYYNYLSSIMLSTWWHFFWKQKD